MRAVVYARYSSDKQSDRSIEDQVRLCRERIAADGHTVTEVYSDHAISGATLLRPGIQAVMQDAARGKFDLVYAEALDRISRDQEEVALSPNMAEIYRQRVAALHDALGSSTGNVEAVEAIRALI